MEPVISVLSLHETVKRKVGRPTGTRPVKNATERSRAYRARQRSKRLQVQKVSEESQQVAAASIEQYRADPVLAALLKFYSTSESFRTRITGVVKAYQFSTRQG